MPSASLQSISWLVRGLVRALEVPGLSDGEDAAHCAVAACVSDKFRIYGKRFDRIERARK
jgi:hypothetical protein